MARNLTVDILRLDAEGDGVAVVEGREILVPFVIPGERVEIGLQTPAGSRDAKRTGAASTPPIADLVRILRASPDRIAPRCRHFGPCGGCSWQHIAYAAQLRLKQAILEDLLEARLGRRTPRVLPTVPTPPESRRAPAPGAGSTDGENRPAGESVPEPWGFRHKASFVFAPGSGQALVMGHYRRGTRSAFAAEECPVHADAANEVAFHVRDALRRARIPAASADGREGIARHVVVRVGEGTGDCLATLVVTGNVKPLRKVTADIERYEAARASSNTRTPEYRPGAASPRFGFHLNVHPRADGFLFGRDTRRLLGASEIRETIAGVNFMLAPTAFFQTNVRIAALMVEHVLRLLPAEGCRRVLDLYSGVGLFALPLARRGQQVIAVEENRDAMAAAEAAARFNRLPEGSFRAIPARVESAMPRLTPRAGSPPWDAVVLDPPRQGCPPDVLDWIFQALRPRLVIYVSCNPQALAADVAAIPAHYTVREIVPYDMFPHTAHIEAIASIVLSGV